MRKPFLRYIFSHFPGAAVPDRPVLPRKKTIPLRWWLGSTALLAVFYYLRLLSADFQPSQPLLQQPILQFVALMILAGAIFLFLAELIIHSNNHRNLMIWLLLAGGLMRVAMLDSTPILEVDFNRYLWDGAVTANGINPYAYSPESVANQDALVPPALQTLGDQPGSTVRKINHAYLRTIYPPVTQAAFALAYWIKPWSLFSWRLILLLFDIATLLLLFAILRRLDLSPLWASIYWLNPLLLKEMFNAAHMDLILFPFLLAALYFSISKKPYWAVIFLGFAAGVKIWPALLFPILLRQMLPDFRKAFISSGIFLALCLAMFLPIYLTGLDTGSGFNAYSNRWQLNDSLFRIVLNISHAGLDISGNPTWNSQIVARRIIAALIIFIVLFLSLRQPANLRKVFDHCLLITTALFLLGPTGFPWYAVWLLPLLAIYPRKSLLLLTLLMPIYYLRYYYEALGNVELFDYYIVWVQFIPVWVLLIWEWHTARQSARNLAPEVARPMKDNQRISVIIPAINEEASIGKVIADIPDWVGKVIVVDNGSVDRTVEIARAAGAEVVFEPERGYGAACLTGIASLPPTDIVVFLDGDYSDYPQEMPLLTDPIIAGEVEMMIGSRVAGNAEKGALTPQAIFGNWLSCKLMRLFWGVKYTDLGPFRAIRFDSLQSLNMRDRNYGWTVEMQIKAAQRDVAAGEVPVSYRKRIGQSKISGTLRGVVGAGTKILSTIFLSAFDWHLRSKWQYRQSQQAGQLER